ncbi:MAG: nitronate monooxygenase [Cyanobacteria bacterium RYN_339]|nr:nitronate monooxygenase [Cyanobacteria bacterium RYN_339]
MWNETPLTQRLGLRWPIIQAPMAGGPSTPELAAAVSAAGGLGMLAAAYQTPEQVRAAIRRVRALTDAPFGVNLLLADPVAVDAADLFEAQHRLEPFRAELGLPTAEPGPPEAFEEVVQVIQEERVPVVTYAFGILARDFPGAVVMGTATTVAEAVALEAAGVDFIVAQGAEAGGHRGTFLGPFEAALTGTLGLVPQLVDAVRTPVIAAGGIMDGRGIAAALALGAVGAQLGTAFLLANEAGTSAPHRAAMSQVTDEATVVTSVFSGKPVRAIENRFVRAMHRAPILPYPLQNALTRDIRKAATARGLTDLMGMWSGQAGRLAREGPAGELVARWAAEVEAVLARLR